MTQNNIAAMLDEYLDVEKQLTELRSKLYCLKDKSDQLKNDIARVISEDESIQKQRLLHTSSEGQLFVVEVDEEWWDAQEPIKVSSVQELTKAN